MHLTTRTKITLIFTLITALIIVILNTLVFETADRESQSSQKAYIESVMKSMYTPDEAKEKIDHLQIISSTGIIIHEQGVFARSGFREK
jgi:Na+-translocating ferredoxin:NAD+ oxidoreductase RnfG subunit